MAEYDFTGPNSDAERERMRADYGVKVDARGIQYTDLPGQGRKYISPGQQPPKLANDTGGLLHGRWQWNTKTGEWEQKLSGTKILTYAVAAGLSAGALSAAAGALSTGGAGGFTGNAALDTLTAEGAKRLPALATSSLGSTALRYGLQYGVPIAGQLIAGKMASNAERDSNRALMDYYQRALDAEREERDYRRGFDEEGRRYDREFGEEGRRYGRYSDTYGRESDEEKLRYGRAGDTYGRLSDEERLWYDRAQAIRDKNYGYQQYGNFVETLEPFRASGSGAVSRMSGLMGGPRPADTGSYLNLARTARESVQAVPNVPGRPTWDYVPNRPVWNYPGQAPPATTASTTAPPVSTTRSVTMRTPGGQTFQVDPSEVDGYEQRGAVRA